MAKEKEPTEFFTKRIANSGIFTRLNDVKGRRANEDPNARGPCYTTL
jgi:hypothetical protein